jgi:type II secretory pathway component PulC
LDEIQASRRSLHLKGTVVGGNKGESYAVISDSKAAEGEVYRLNDLLQNARIVEILPDRVILEAEGKYEAIAISYELGLNDPGDDRKYAISTEHPKGQTAPPPTVRGRGTARETRRLPGR